MVNPTNDPGIFNVSPHFRMCNIYFKSIKPLFSITPLRTSHSSNSPPGIFSTLAYLFTSKDNLFISQPLNIILTDFIAKSTIKFCHLAANFVPIQHNKAFFTSSSLLKSIGTEISLSIFNPSYKA